MISKIEGREHLERRGGAIVNTNKDGFLAYLAQREKTQQDSRRIEALEAELSELKQLVRQLAGAPDATKPNPG